MTKNELIAQLQDIEGNPEIEIFDGENWTGEVYVNYPKEAAKKHPEHGFKIEIDWESN